MQNFSKAAIAVSVVFLGQRVLGVTCSAEVVACRKSYIANNCAAFASSGALNSCERGTPVTGSFAKLTAGCQKDVAALQKRLGSDALVACTNRSLGYDDPDEATKDAALVAAGGRLSTRAQKLKKCMEAQAQVGNPGDEIGRLQESLKCLQPKEQSQLACEAVKVGAYGSDVGFSARGTLLSLADQERAAVTPELRRTTASYNALSSAQKEHDSNEHLNQLVDSSLGGHFKALATKLGLNVKAMSEGILDSDEGKITQAWEDRIIKPQTKAAKDNSDAVLDMLRGSGDAHATTLFKEILADAHLPGSFLNPSLSNDRLREVFEATPSLRGYLHETVGYANAVEALNKGELSDADFKVRIQTSLFHNGPDAGYWATFGNTFLPGALKAGFAPGAPQTAKDASVLFQNTVFAQRLEADKAQLPGENKPPLAPSYPFTTSPEGVYHVIVDRLSQGTRVGMAKILEEVGAPAFPNADEMLFLNPLNTQRQLQALSAHVEAMTNLNRLQKDEFKKTIDLAIARLDAERAFIAKYVKREPALPSDDKKITWPMAAVNGPLTSLTVSWPDPMCPQGKVCPDISRHIGPKTSVADAGAILKQAMLAEERVNGDPMLELGQIRDGSARDKLREAVSKGWLSSAGCPVGGPGDTPPAPTGAR